MNRSEMSSVMTLSLRHAWHSDADAAALRLCREQLLEMRISLSDAIPGDVCDLIKMHGMDISDARRSQPGSLKDLRSVAAESQWADRLPGLIRAHMQTGESWHGIPLGIHQSNRMWVNPAWAEKLGGTKPSGWPDFLIWLEQAKRYLAAPLAVGAETWQISVIFEAVVLATGGKKLYEETFVDMLPSVWRDPAMHQALEYLMALREYVDDQAFARDWAFQASRVARGEAAVQFMGDWARLASPNLLEWSAPGTAHWFVAVVDYLVPLAHVPLSIAELAALSLTEPAFQARLAMRKGCIPVLHTASTWTGRQLPAQQHLLLSVAFEQCCATAVRQSILATVARHFVDRLSAAACALALAKSAH